MKETEEDTNKWKDSSCSWIGRIDIVKMAILPKTVYRFNVICQITHVIFYRTRTNIPKIYMEPQQKTKNRIAKAILRKKNKAGDIILSDFRQYYKATVIKTAWYWLTKTDIWISGTE